MSAHTDADSVQPGAVVQFDTDQPRRHHFVHINEGIALRVRMGVANLTVYNADGTPKQVEAAPSAAQTWLKAAVTNHHLSAAMSYVPAKPTWGELYKAFEALKDGGLIIDLSETRRRRFTGTANAAERHRLGKFELPEQPMALWEGRALLLELIEAAVSRVLENKSSPESAAQ